MSPHSEFSLDLLHPASTDIVLFNRHFSHAQTETDWLFLVQPVRYTSTTEGGPSKTALYVVSVGGEKFLLRSGNSATGGRRLCFFFLFLRELVRHFALPFWPLNTRSSSSSVYPDSSKTIVFNDLRVPVFVYVSSLLSLLYEHTPGKRKNRKTVYVRFFYFSYCSFCVFG